MAQNDTKVVQSLIQATLRNITSLESVEVNLQAVKTKFEDINPNLTGTNLTTQQAIDAKALINEFTTFLQTTHAAIIATLKSKDCPSHDEKALD
jgi:hypothetical protein